MLEASLPYPDAVTMAKPSGAKSARWSFDEFEFDVRTLVLTRRGESLALQPRPARVLAVLLQAGGELVTPGELGRQVWGEDVHIDLEQSLKTCIKQVRAALGDCARAPRFVETLPRRGYRLVVPAQEIAVRAERGSLALRWSARLSAREIALVGVILSLMALLWLSWLRG